ncbi:monovalent cation/H(+) antiporter subunit G [Arhodomonas sp. SL1]|uniref:monovalent cation/H(+) antiporter subunit G n=1 Tax=Arhodomonas sp. SL1 TaxID=3425691 RepID=UPI003F882D15
MIELAAILVGAAGAVFFLGGSIGLLRFPDVYTRLHALTKADNLGLGLLALGVGMHQGQFWLGLRLFLVWLLMMAASTVACHLLAGEALREGRTAWRR